MLNLNFSTSTLFTSKQSNLSFSNPFTNTTNTISLKYDNTKLNIDGSGYLTTIGEVNKWVLSSSLTTIIYHNSTLSQPEIILNSVDTFYSFTSTTGTNNITFPIDTVCTIFMIGGGGGGDWNHAGGAGAGAYYSGNYTFLANTTYNINIGNGGSGTYNGGGLPTNGGDTYLSISGNTTKLLWVKGGAKGAGANYSTGNNGGCGSGGPGYKSTITAGITDNTGTNGTGFNGGDGLNSGIASGILNGGGGGGIGGNGYNAVGIVAGKGGDGLTITIKGINEVYGGGGGGGAWLGSITTTSGLGGGVGSTIVGGGGSTTNGGVAGNAVANTGSGGGGGSGGYSTGGNGSSGVFILRYTKINDSIEYANSVNVLGSVNIGVGSYTNGKLNVNGNIKCSEIYRDNIPLSKTLSS